MFSTEEGKNIYRHRLRFAIVCAVKIAVIQFKKENGQSKFVYKATTLKAILKLFCLQVLQQIHVELVQ